MKKELMVYYLDKLIGDTMGSNYGDITERKFDGDKIIYTYTIRDVSVHNNHIAYWGVKELVYFKHAFNCFDYEISEDKKYITFIFDKSVGKIFRALPSTRGAGYIINHIITKTITEIFSEFFVSKGITDFSIKKGYEKDPHTGRRPHVMTFGYNNDIDMLWAAIKDFMDMMKVELSEYNRYNPTNALLYLLNVELVNRIEIKYMTEHNISEYLDYNKIKFNTDGIEDENLDTVKAILCGEIPLTKNDYTDKMIADFGLHDSDEYFTTPAFSISEHIPKDDENEE